MISTSFCPSVKGTTSPMRARGMPKCATSAATRRSQCRASSQPPAMASPWTMAMVGWRERSTRWRVWITPPSGSPASPRCASISRRSIPEQKTGPAPRTTITRTSREESSSSKRALRAWRSARFMAFRFSGRLRVTLAMPSMMLTRTSSAMGSSVSERGDCSGRHLKRAPEPCQPVLESTPHRAVEEPPMTVFPGFTLPDELRAIREQVRRFIQEEIIPLEQRLDPDAPEIPREDFIRLSAKTKEAGLWALGIPEEYGGGGLDTFSMCVILEEMSQHRMGLYVPGCGVFGRNPPPAIWAGSKEQIQKYAVPAVREGHETFWAITEPSGGADPAGAIQTRAEKRGDRWVLNGRKVFISRAHDAPWGVVFARTDKAKGRGGISCFIVEHGTPGFTAKPFKVIRTSAIPTDVVFEDCSIPAENLVGQEGQGLELAFDLLVKQRFPYSACNLGVAVAAHRMAIAYAKERSTFGAKLAERQAIQWMLADAEVEIRAARWLIWEGAWKADRGEDARVEASIAKLYSSEVLGRVVDAAVQIHGGYGVSKEFPLERWYREARVRRIGEGPSEVHRMVIARSLFR